MPEFGPEGITEVPSPPALATDDDADEPQEEQLTESKDAEQTPKQKEREERYDEVRERHAKGQSIRGIAEEMGISRNVVKRYLRQDHCPDWRPGQPRQTQLDPFQGLIDEQLRAGKANAAQLHRELTEKGYKGSPASVRRFVSKRLAVLRGSIPHCSTIK